MIEYDENSAYYKIFSRIREHKLRKSGDFTDIPESNQTELDKTAIKLINSFEFISVPKTKIERGFKTFWLTKISRVESCIKIIRGYDEPKKKNVILVMCGDESFIISYNQHVKDYYESRNRKITEVKKHYQSGKGNYNYFPDAATLDAVNAGLIPIPYRPTAGLYMVTGTSTIPKEINSYEELEEFFINFIAEYIANFTTIG